MTLLLLCAGGMIAIALLLALTDPTPPTEYLYAELALPDDDYVPTFGREEGIEE
jgi:hypothetical protein